MTAIPAWLQRWQQTADDELLSPSDLRTEQERNAEDVLSQWAAPLRQMAGERWPADADAVLARWAASLRQMADERWPGDRVEDTTP